jgi:hypothetical protein
MLRNSLATPYKFIEAQSHRMGAYFIICSSPIIDSRTRYLNSDRQNSNLNNRNTATNIFMDGIDQNNYLFQESISN